MTLNSIFLTMKIDVAGTFYAPQIWKWCRGSEIHVAEEFFCSYLKLMVLKLMWQAEEFFLHLKFETGVAALKLMLQRKFPRHHFCHCNPPNWCAIAGQLRALMANLLCFFFGFRVQKLKNFIKHFLKCVILFRPPGTQRVNAFFLGKLYMNL